MKLLFDEHISFRAVRAIQDVFPEARHLKFFSIEEATDAAIWSFAKKEGFAIVTKDDDFREMSMALGHPPKVIWIKSGNLRNSGMENFLREKADIISRFVESADESLLVLK
jgi:predicted nuclease of predicted toxin-antitoxin system